jgi:hypothetical protein
MFAVGDSAGLRDKAQEITKRITSATTDLSLNQKAHRALREEPTPKQDAAAAHYLERSLLEYRLAGVDRDEATRAKIRQFQDRITELSLTFSRNVADDVRQVTATKAELDGMPDDYIARHKPAPEGIYTLTTDPPDSAPVYNFAKDPGLRLRMYIADHQRAYPKNKENKAVVMDLLKARQDLATTLGFATFADLSTADQMIGTQQNVKALLQQVEAVAHGPADHEHALLLAFAQKQQPGLANISLADSSYWSEQYRRSTYNEECARRVRFMKASRRRVQVESPARPKSSRLCFAPVRRAPGEAVVVAQENAESLHDGVVLHAPGTGDIRTPFPQVPSRKPPAFLPWRGRLQGSAPSSTGRLLQLEPAKAEPEDGSPAESVSAHRSRRRLKTETA